MSTHEQKIAALHAEIKRLEAEISAQQIFPSWAQALLEESICLDCRSRIKRDEKAVRGCHSRCHKRALRAMEITGKTDEEMVASGIFAPKQKAGRKPRQDTMSAKMAGEEARRVAEQKALYDQPDTPVRSRGKPRKAKLSKEAIRAKLSPHEGSQPRRKNSGQ